MRTRAPQAAASTTGGRSWLWRACSGIGSGVADREITATTRAFLVAIAGALIALVVLALSSLL